MESYQKGGNHLGAIEYWSTPIRDHMMKILVERTQKAGDKLIDKSLPFGYFQLIKINHDAFSLSVPVNALVVRICYFNRPNKG